ncbi:MAG: hypothetical protein JXB29_02025, partial [Sedimentisphaerales bacterium]|nr:hypothetical protein [Sedimentisphaerales bacterium]
NYSKMLIITKIDCCLFFPVLPVIWWGKRPDPADCNPQLIMAYPKYQTCPFGRLGTGSELSRRIRYTKYES